MTGASDDATQNVQNVRADLHALAALAAWLDNDAVEHGRQAVEAHLTARFLMVPPPLGSEGWDPESFDDLAHATHFWLRRRLDRTDGATWVGIRRLLGDIDAAWLADLRGWFPGARVDW